MCVCHGCTLVDSVLVRVCVCVYMGGEKKGHTTPKGPTDVFFVFVFLCVFGGNPERRHEKRTHNKNAYHVAKLAMLLLLFFNHESDVFYDQIWAPLKK